MTDKSKFAGTVLAKRFKTDRQAEENGVWRFDPESGLFVKIRRSTILDHRRALRKHHKPFAHLPRVDPKTADEIKWKAGAEVLVSGWMQAKRDEDGAFVYPEGVDALDDEKAWPLAVPFVDSDGNEIRPSQENLLAAFTEMPDFFAWVEGEADTFENYRVEAVEDAAKNFSRSSTGSASGERQEPAPSLTAEPSAESESVRSSGSQS